MALLPLPTIISFTAGANTSASLSASFAESCVHSSRSISFCESFVANAIHDASPHFAQFVFGSNL